MINPFQLTHREQRHIISTFTQLCSLRTIPLSYYDSSPDIGYGGSTSSEWSDYEDVKCTLESISELNIKRYPYGNITEGDLVLLFPPNHTIPDSTKYRVEYDNKVYICDTGLLSQDMLQDEIILYYAGVFKL